MKENTEKLYRLAMSGDEKAEEELFLYLKRKRAIPEAGALCGNKVDKFGVNLHIGDHIAYAPSWGDFGLGIVRKDLKKRIGIWLLGHPKSPYPRYSTVEASNCISLGRLALYAIPWAKGLVEEAQKCGMV